MLIDDDQKTLLGLSTLLKTQGFTKPTIINNPERVIPEIINNKPDVVLLDLHMPNISGFSLLEKIKRDFPDTIVIMITGDDTVDVAIRCTKLGATDYFVKPLDHKRLIDVINKSIKEKKYNDEQLRIQQHLIDNKVATHEYFSNILTEKYRDEKPL